MIDDSIISEETRKLAIQKGWDVEKVMRYLLSQSSLQKWLREVHNIEVFVTYWSEKTSKEFGHKCYEVLVYDKKVESEYVYSEYFSIYEEALEDGLYQALKLI